MNIHCQRRPRKGNVLVLAALMMVAMFAFLAFAVDLGYLQVARTELQRSADAAAIAAAWELIDESTLSGYANPYQTTQDARTTAGQYTVLNKVLNQDPVLAQEDVAVGYLANPSDPTEPMCFDGMNLPNAVRVQVRRTANQNGEVPLFFARVLGHDRAAVQAEATAAMLTNFNGFRAPASGENLDMLPFAVHKDTWNDLLAGIGTDDWTWDPESQQLTSGADGIREISMFPQSTGGAGNFGTVDIGNDNNSTADIARQILHGVSPQDLEHHGGKLELDANGELFLNGDTGISAGMKDELVQIKGKPRTILIYSDVTGPGNNATYTIVNFVGIRITRVKLTGSNKRVIIQPANVVSAGGIPANGGQTSYFIYSPVTLVR